MFDEDLFRKWLLSCIKLRVRWVQLDSHQLFNTWSFRKGFTLDSQSRHRIFQFHQAQQTIILFNHIMDLIFVQNCLYYVAFSRYLLHFYHRQRYDVS